MAFQGTKLPLKTFYSTHAFSCIKNWSGLCLGRGVHEKKVGGYSVYSTQKHRDNTLRRQAYYAHGFLWMLLCVYACVCVCQRACVPCLCNWISVMSWLFNKRERDLFELGIPLSSSHCFEALEKLGDRIKDAVRNRIKEGSGEIFLSLGMLGCSEIPSLVHTKSDVQPLSVIPLHVYIMYVSGANTHITYWQTPPHKHTNTGWRIHISNGKSCLSPHPPYQILDWIRSACFGRKRISPHAFCMRLIGTLTITAAIQARGLLAQITSNYLRDSSKKKESYTPHCEHALLPVEKK